MLNCNPLLQKENTKKVTENWAFCTNDEKIWLLTYSPRMNTLFPATRVLMDHLKCRDVAFAELLAGLLQYNPGKFLKKVYCNCTNFRCVFKFAIFAISMNE